MANTIIPNCSLATLITCHMIDPNSKSAALAREHLLLCNITWLHTEHIVAVTRTLHMLTKKENRLKKKILLATLREDQESISYYNAQFRHLQKCEWLGVTLLREQLNFLDTHD